METFLQALPSTRSSLSLSETLGPEPYQEPVLGQNYLVMEGPGSSDGISCSAFLPKVGRSQLGKAQGRKQCVNKATYEGVIEEKLRENKQRFVITLTIFKVNLILGSLL